MYIALDDVPVVDFANSSVHLLNNSKFENGKLDPTGWTKYD
jgi:hypothetical protein